MTDRAFEPPNPDPFAQPGGGDDGNPFAKIASGAEPPPTSAPAPAPKPANDDENPFTKLAGGTPVPDTSATGAFARGAARGALPAIGSIPAIGAGAEAGAAFGAPFGPIGMGIGGFAGGVAGGFGGAALIAKAQDYVLSKLPESWTDVLGMSERQEKLDQTYHGTASFLGGLAPYAVTMRPGIATSKALPENATALQRIMAHPATAHVFSGAVVGGMELGQEAVSGNPVDWSHVAIATGFGVVFNQPTKIGQRLTEAGAQPARRVLGKPEPTAAVALPPGTETEPQPAPTSEAVAAPAMEAEQPPPAPPVTAADFRNEITERTRTGRPYDLAPTVADAADLKVMGPGVTEDVFLGSHEQDPAALQTAREAKRTEHSVIGEPPQPDIHAVARRMHPETFERYDELRSRRAEFARWIEDRNNPSDVAVTEAEEKRDALQKQLDEHVAERKGYASGPEARKLRAQAREAQRDIDALQERRTAYTEGKAEQTPELIAARQHLLATDVELRDLHGEVQAAYRRAADAIGSETVPPEVKAKPAEPVAEAPVAAPAATAEPVEPAAATPAAETPEPTPAATAEAPQAPPIVPAAAPEPPKPRTIEQQRDFIRQDVAQQLIKAGRPKEEAEAAGALMAARYETRAARFNGKRGNAEELYLAESAEILGPKQRSTQQAQPAAPRKVNEEKLSLLQFLAHRGGLKETGDLKSILDGNPTVRGFGKLFREDGMTEDRAREAASEAGYLVHNQETTGEKASIRDLHEAIHEEARGRKRYRFGHEPEAKIDRDESEAQREAAGSEELPEGIEPHEMEPDELAHLSEEDRAAMELLQIDAYHGTPHHFERFDVSKIGTGEGAQAYGHGLYFAEREGVAKAYQENLTQPKFSHPDFGDNLGPHQTDDIIEAAIRKTGTSLPDRKIQEIAVNTTEALKNGDDFNHFRKFVRQSDFDQPLKDAWFAALDEGAKFKTERPTGALYKVSLKPDKADLLDWDKPLSEQPAKVRDPIQKKLGEPTLSKSNVDWAGDMVKLNGRIISEIPKGQAVKENLWDYVRGKDALQQLSPDPATQSKILSESGIPGIKYADQGSRGTEGGTHNFVIFDDKDVEITHRNGEPVTGQDRADAVKELFQRGEQLNQTTRGSLLPRTTEEFERGLRPVMRLAAEQNASTFIHESGHLFLEELMRDAAHEAAPDQLKSDADTVKRWLNINEHDDLNTGWPGARGKRARAAHERFATGFEQYLREGTAPSPGLAAVFAKFRQWLTSIYETLKGLGKPINEDIRNVFDRMLSTEPQRTVIAPETEVAKSLADHHDLDAAEISPHEAEPAMARVDAERERGYEELPEDIRSGIEAETAKFYDEHEPAAEPPGEDGEGDGRLRKVQPGGGEPNGEAGSGGGGPANGPQRPSVDAAGAESPGLRAAGPESGNRENLESVPLAPSPAAGFPRADAFNVGKDGNVRVENITSVPAFMRAIEESSERIGGGGPITMGEMIDLADSMAIDPKNITETKLAAMFGGIQNLSSKIWALRTAIRDSAEIVHAAMRKVRDDGSDAAVAEFALAMSRHDMMQSVLSSVTTETGRGTGMSFRNMEGWQKAEDLNELIKANTGRTLFQLKQMAKLGAQLDSPAKVSKFLRDAQRRSFGGMILEYWINGLISGPATHVTYMLGNQVLALQKAVPETLIASAIGAGRAAMGRGGERVRAGEALTGLKSMVQALPTATQAALEALRTGQPTLLPGQQGRPLTPFMGDTMLHVARSLTNDPVTWGEVGAGLYSSLRGLRDGLKAGSALLAAGGEPGAPLLGLHYSPLGQIPDIAVRGVPVLPIGSAIRLPGRSVSAIHSFFATSNYIREVAAEAYRTASHENLTGDAFATRIADIRTNPSEDTMQRAITGAYASTLMSEGGAFVKALSQLTNAKATLPLIGEIAPLKFIDPFVHIGANVIDQAIVQRSPLGLLSSEIRADLAGHNGNVAQDMAAARMLAGTALSLAFGSLAMEGYITGSGPKDPAKAAMWREVYQPHSVRIGDMWYQVNRLGPMGMLLGVAADLYDVAHDASEGEMLTAAAHLQHAVTQNILDESFMRGPADLIKAIEDPGRYGESYLKQFASSFLPFSVGMAQIARASDPYSRQARNVTDALLNKIPGQSEKLFPRINIWGEPTPNPDAMAHAGLTAVYLKKVNSDPVNKAMLDLGISPAKVERKIRNVELTDAEYDDFARLAGRTTKMRLDSIARSPDYQRWPNHVRHDVIAEVVKQSREAARGMMMMKFPHIPRDASEALRKRKTGE